MYNSQLLPSLHLSFTLSLYSRTPFTHTVTAHHSHWEEECEIRTYKNTLLAMFSVSSLSSQKIFLTFFIIWIYAFIKVTCHATQLICKQ